MRARCGYNRGSYNEKHLTINDSAMFNDFYKIYSESTNKKSKYWVLIKDIDTALLFF